MPGLEKSGAEDGSVISRSLTLLSTMSLTGWAAGGLGSRALAPFSSAAVISPTAFTSVGPPLLAAALRGLAAIAAWALLAAAVELMAVPAAPELMG
jgi:hypothetical protein